MLGAERVTGASWLHPSRSLRAGSDPVARAYQAKVDWTMDFLLAPLVRQVEVGRLVLETSGGFYHYGSGAADAVGTETISSVTG